jgi:hypothetical protein
MGFAQVEFTSSAAIELRAAPHPALRATFPSKAGEGKRSVVTDV